MRLVLAAPLYPPEPGGPATYAKLLVEGLPSLGVEVKLVRFSKVRKLPNGIRQMAYCVRLFSASWRADMILALDAISVGWPSYIVHFVLRKRLVVKVVGDHVWEQGKQRFGVTDSLDAFTSSKQRLHPYLRFLQMLQRIVVQSASTVIVPSQYLKGIVRAWGVPDERIVIVRNAVAIGILGTVPEAVRALPRPLVVTAGRLVPWKGVGGVIDAVAGSGASLAVVGGGPEQESLMSHAAGMREHRIGVGLPKFSYAFTGALSHPDLLATLKEADLFVLNSTYEGLSHLLLEAVALGVPTIATDAGGNPEALEGVPYGCLVPVGKPGELKIALEEMLAHPPQRTTPPTEGPERMLRETAAILAV